ncbi:isoprenylcysteine carboxylmethyltransferase family protein [Candidatus Pacearchaeota archaeon]|nr:isoprenylcysteine carboxylmethyltransferase family protein [Candidatus Pacearchaeota archaeon]
MNNKKYINSSVMWMIVVIGFFLIFIFVPKFLMFSVSLYNFIIFFICMIVFLGMFYFSLKKNKEAVYGVDRISNVVRNGIYSKIRHPIYVGDFILIVGMFILFPMFSFFISLFWVLFVLLFWMKLEEKLMIEKFGGEYIDYKKRVGMVFPRI